ncbi:MAG: hypothetical protein IJ289_04850 [Clostridia bacterium]|nr:hypothetical protein [Clostridia bacterium]
MKKRILSVILFVMMLFTMCVASSAASDYAVDFVMDAPSTVSSGEQFTVSVGIDDMKNHILSGTIQLCYDPSMLEYISVSALGGNTTDFFSTINDEEAGKIIISFFSIDTCPEAFVDILTAEFRAKKTGYAKIEVLNFNDWSDEYNGTSLWFSDYDGFPVLRNNEKTVTIADYADDYSVEYIIGQPSSVEENEQFTVSVAVDNMKNHVLTCTLEFSYDTDMLEMVSCECPGDTTDGSFYQDTANDYIYVLNKETDGSVIVAFMPVDMCNSDVIDIIEFTFVSKKTGVAEIEITGEEWHDDYYGETLWLYEGGSNVPEGMERTLSVTVEESAPAEFILGDVNGDTKISAADARIVLRAAARIETLSASAEKSADVDKNGKVNAADARMILRVAARIDNFENPVPPSPPPAPPVDTTPSITLKTNMSSFYLDKGGTAVVDIEVVGDLGGRKLYVTYDSNTFRCEWEENWYTYTSTGNDVAVLYVSPLKYTSAKTIKVYVEGYENTLYTTFTVSAASDGWYDYGGYAGAVDFGAYTRVAPHFYYMSEEADSIAFFYSLSDLAAAGYSADDILTDFFTYLEAYGYEYVDYTEDSEGASYTFYNSEYDILYSYTLVYDNYGDISDVMILFMI